ncbi:GAF domain-containing sensor histidine kinase [Dictyobacter kobayashii]|uniref:histidine kinase n=1 Tax=Dictyobacter kobayashii TaxID=2014872 RepID=A0A402AUY5_9CHLR|nr:ATP-binding protein [Dictyobacter kobayashii]GCE22869.1 hypothetical protein KDK_66690 [Dictyobacter kobayashii]
MTPVATDNSGWDTEAPRRLAAFSRMSMALMREFNEGRLIENITHTCCEATHAEFAACSLRSVDREGKPIGPSDGSIFHIACVVGVTEEQRIFAETIPLGGIGFLRPIFNHGLPVRIDDILSPNLASYRSYLLDHEAGGFIFSPHLREYIFAEPLHSVGLPPGHPPVRSFLGAPLVNYDGEVLGGLLLGHSQPGHFSAYDEVLIVGLASVAAVALENVRLYHISQLRDMELKAHQELEAHTAALQMILDEMPGSVYLVHGPEARLVLVNRAGASLWRGSWQPEQPMKEFLQQSQIMIFDDNGVPIPSEQLATMRAVTQGETTRQQQEKLRYPDGSYLPMIVSTSIIDVSQWLSPAMRSVLSMKEREPLVVVVHQDVTALMEAERLKDEFIGIAAHELRAPLAVLRGFSQTLMMQSERGHGRKLADWQLEAVEGIDQATTRMTELTDDLLDVTRLQAGCLSIQLEPCDLIALIRRVVKRLQITTTHHRINVHTGLDYLVAMIDINRIEQILINLLNNAIKYSPAGGDIDLDISEGHESAQVRVAVVSVRDYGIGIPADQQGKIFDRFCRADNARAISGTGLGLYLCRALIEQHYGQIWFESIENEGTTFYITLPVYMEEKPITCPLENL